MPRAAPMQTSFNAGEWGPLLDGRVDVDIYRNSVSTLINGIPTVQGPCIKRMGQAFVQRADNSDNAVRLIPFEFNTEQAYILEFGNQYIRFYRDRSPITEPDLTITAISQANPGVITSAGHSLSNGDWVYISGVAGMTEINSSHPYIVANSLTNTFTLTDLDGTAIDTSGFTAYTSGGVANRVYEITANVPWLTAELKDLQFTQSNDVMYVTHTNHKPVKISRTGHTAWTATEIDFLDGPFLPLNTTTTTLTLSGTTGSVTVTASAVTGINSDTGFQATDIGRLIRWKDPAGDFTWLEITARASTTSVTATIRGANASATTATADWRLGVWSDTDGFPSAVGFSGLRLVFGGGAVPNRLDMSNSDDFENFAPSDPDGTVADDHAITYTLNSRRVNSIYWFEEDERALLVGTSGREWVVAPSSTSGVLTPTDVDAKNPTSFGSKLVQAVKVNSTVLFVQRTGRVVGRIGFSFENDGFRTDDLNLFASSIALDGINEIDYQGEPDNIMWGIRADGVLLGLTYKPEQSVTGWSRHETEGEYESVAVIPSSDGLKNEVWVAVKRTINGTVHRFVEYITDTFDEDTRPEDAFYVDAGLTFDGRSNPAATLTPGATTGDGVTFTAGLSIFVAADVGKHIMTYNAVTHTITGLAEITAQAGTTATCNILIDFASTDAIASGSWELRERVTTISGLDHLEGEEVTILVDGATHPNETVSGGAITLDDAATVVQVGLGYSFKLLSQNLEAGSADGVAQGKVKRNDHVIFRLYRSGSFHYGAAIDETLATMDEIDTRSDADRFDLPLDLITGDQKEAWPKGYETEGKIAILQNKPLPLFLLALLPRVKTNE